MDHFDHNGSGRQATQTGDARSHSPIPDFAFQHRNIYDLARAFEYAYEAVDAVQTAAKVVTNATDMLRALPSQLRELSAEVEKHFEGALADFVDESKCGSGAYMMHWQCRQIMAALDKETDRIVEKANNFIRAASAAELKKLQRERLEIEKIYRDQKAATAAASQCLVDIVNEQAKYRDSAKWAEQKLQQLRGAKAAGFWSHIIAYWRQ